jgi:hypothetical protein
MLCTVVAHHRCTALQCCVHSARCNGPRVDDLRCTAVSCRLVLWLPVSDVSLAGANCCAVACCVLMMVQIVIDVSKHAVLGKFNDIRPGIYREYMRDLCSDSLDKHSHNTHKLVGACWAPTNPGGLDRHEFAKLGCRVQLNMLSVCEGTSNLMPVMQCTVRWALHGIAQPTCIACQQLQVSLSLTGDVAACVCVVCRLGSARWVLRR